MGAVQISTDVIIVGAGPAGLATANYLGLAGIRAVVIERNAGTVDEPRAVARDAHSMMLLSSLSLSLSLRYTTPLTTRSWPYAVE